MPDSNPWKAGLGWSVSDPAEGRELAGQAETGRVPRNLKGSQGLAVWGRWEPPAKIRRGEASPPSPALHNMSCRRTSAFAVSARYSGHTVTDATEAAWGEDAETQSQAGMEDACPEP